MKLKYWNQIVLTVGLVTLGNVLETFLETWIYRSIAYVICGLIWIIHPVLLGDVPPTKKQVRWVRIAGIILILIGVFTRMIVW